MVIMRFRNNEEHRDLMKKVKKMREFAEELEDCLKMAAEEEDIEFRGGYGNSYRYEDEERPMRDMSNRYSAMRRMGGGMRQ